MYPKMLINIWNSILRFTHLKAIFEKEQKQKHKASVLSPVVLLPELRRQSRS